MSNGTKPDLSLPTFIRDIEAGLRNDTSWLVANVIKDPLNNYATLITIPSAQNVAFSTDADIHIRWALSMLNNDGAAAGLFDSNDPRIRSLFFAMGGNPVMNMVLFNADFNSRLQEVVIQFARTYFGPNAEKYPEVLLAMSHWFQQMGGPGGGGGSINVFGIPVQGRTASVATAAGVVSAAVPNLFSVLGQVAQMMALKSAGGTTQGVSGAGLYNIFATVFGRDSFKDNVEAKKGDGGVTWKEFTDLLSPAGGRPMPSLAVTAGTTAVAWTPAQGAPTLKQAINLPDQALMGTHFNARYGGLRALVQGILISLASSAHYDKTKQAFTSEEAKTLYNAITGGKESWLRNELADNVTA